MIKVLSRGLRSTLSLLNRRYFSTTSNEKDNQLLSVLDNSQKFYKNLYGVELDKHIMPQCIVSFPWRAEQMKVYRKKMPSYVVVLIKKVIDDAQHLMKHEDNQKQAQPIDNFYNVATYCKVKYEQTHTELQGLFRVKLNKVQALAQKNNKQDTMEIIENHEEEQDEDVDDQVENTQSTSTQLSIKKNPRKLNLNLYYLDVDKVEEPLVTIDYNLEIRLKFLIETYKTFFPESKYNFLLFNTHEALKIVYLMGQQMSNQNIKIKQMQTFLQSTIFEKMVILQDVMHKTFDWKIIYRHIEKSAENNLRNKKFYQLYSEILKIAKQNIDGKKGKELFIEKVTKEFYEKKPPKNIKQVFEQEKEKYIQMDQTAVEASVAKKYLEDLSKIPYSTKSEEHFDLQHAQKALDEEHYGMKEVKDAILQIIAVGKLKGSLKGKIFCLVGGPGLGKTTIAKSIATALGRKFYSISLGGVTDSSVLKGHRRTYVGAYSGKIIEALKICGTNNPVILLDEIDKMGSSYQGDPRSELLQILDPNQNNSFVDNYLDVPIDLSNVLFVCSANYQSNISKPLIDRMDKIKLSSYTDDEKKEIFNRHLIRRAVQKSGVKPEQFKLNPNVLQSLIYEYSLGEPGVRRLEKNIEKILERVAYQIVEGVQQLPINIAKENLKDYLGNSYFIRKNHEDLQIGMAISLGGGDYGSRLTHIQSFKKSFVGKKEHRRAVMYTGSLGDIFKEAMNISYTYARNFLYQSLSNTFLYENEVHIHAPDGASKKDGSMDSLTICASLVSLAIQKGVKRGYAMSGEINLHGKVLRTHGIKQKVLLARRQKIWNVILPTENKADVQMLNESIKQGFNFHFVSEFKEVYDLLLDQTQPAVSSEFFANIVGQQSKTQQLL